MNVRRIALIAAAVMGIVFGFSLFLFVRSYQHANSPEAQRTRVLVANRNIDKGVTVTPDMFTPAMRDRATIDPDSLSDTTTLHGQFALISLPVGAVLTASKIGTPRDLGLSLRLKPGERALSISVDHVKDVSGLVLPGDRVDILAEGPRINNKIQQAVTLLHGILVLAVGQGLESASASPSPDQANASTVTLALNSQQATILMTADQNATIRLALRSPKESIGSHGVEHLIYNGETIYRSGEPARAAAPVAQAPAPNPPGAPSKPIARVSSRINGVEVIEGTALAGQR